MLLTISILGPILILAIATVAYNKGVEDARRQKDLQVIHRIPDDVEKVKIVHMDEFDSPTSVSVYTRNNRWLNGFQKVIVSWYEQL